MKLEKKIDSLQKQAAVVRYVRSPLGLLVRPLPTGCALRNGETAWFIINAN